MTDTPADFPVITDARGFEAHPLRAEILGEIHARPFRLTTRPRIFLHYGFELPRGGLQAELDAFEGLCRHRGIPGPGPGVRHHVIPFGNGTLRWERHAEFVTYTWDGPLSSDAPDFSEMPSTHPFGQSFRQPGPLLVACRLDLVAGTSSLAEAARFFDPTSLCVCEVNGGAAAAITDFRPDGDGRTRILVLDRTLTEQQSGALCQRLLEIETYRTLAMLGLPEAQRLSPDLRRIERELTDLGARARTSEGLDANRSLLADISRLTADVEAGAAETSYRFGATRAYYEIVQDRLTSIHETHVPGFGSWSSFLKRRMEPAMRTVDVTDARQNDLSAKLARAAEHLRTRVDIELEEQNRALLETMNKRARQQLRLQHTVEGLSIAAVSYYVIGLAGYVFKALKEVHLLPVDPNVATGVAVPVVVGLVAIVVRNIRRAHNDPAGGDH